MTEHTHSWWLLPSASHENGSNTERDGPAGYGIKEDTEKLRREGSVHQTIARLCVIEHSARNHGHSSFLPAAPKHHAQIEMNIQRMK